MPQNLKGASHIDIWKLKLDGSGAYQRLTYFSDHPGYKASNPVVSDDGRFIAFQLAKSREAAGVGHGIVVHGHHAHRCGSGRATQSRHLFLLSAGLRGLTRSLDGGLEEVEGSFSCRSQLLLEARRAAGNNLPNSM